MGLHVHEYGAVHLATTSRELIHSQHPRCWRRWLWQRPHQLQQGGAAAGQPEALTEALTWSTAERQPHPLQGDAQPLRPSGVASDHVGHLLSKGLAGATRIAAPEAAYPEVQQDELADEGLIGHAAGIAAVHAPRATTTERAASKATAVMHDHVHLAIGDQDTFDVQRLEMREQVSDAQTRASDARAVRHARRQQGLPEWSPGARNWRLSRL